MLSLVSPSKAKWAIRLAGSGSVGVTLTIVRCQHDVVDEQGARTAFEADRQLGDTPDVQAGQVDVPHLPGLAQEVVGVTVIGDFGTVDLDVHLGGCVGRIAIEPQRQALDPVLCPVLRGLERAGGFGDSAAGVVIDQRHGLSAAMDDRLFGEGCFEIAHLRVVAGRFIPIDPGQEDGLARVDVVGVALEVFDDDERLGRKAPDVTFPGADRLGVVDLIDPPVVGRRQIERARIGGAVGNRID